MAWQDYVRVTSVEEALQQLDTFDGEGRIIAGGTDLILQLRSGEKKARVIRDAVQALILGHPFTAIDYITLCDPVTLDDVEVLGDKNLLALAVRVGKTRLIDNCLLENDSN